MILKISYSRSLDSSSSERASRLVPSGLAKTEDSFVPPYLSTTVPGCNVSSCQLPNAPSFGGNFSDWLAALDAELPVEGADFPIALPVQKFLP